MNNQTNLTETDIFRLLQQTADFDITPYEGNINFDDSSKYTKLELSTAQKIHINALLQQLPSAVIAGKLPQMYTITFPEGLPHTLMQLKNGGFSTSIIGMDGKIAGVASLAPMVAEAAILGVFTVMSVITGQFFLFQINKELKKINQTLDKIVEFLYGDKKAELLSEISFVKCVHENFNSIMMQEQQRIATISGLQQSKKVAIKDVEFYMCDLENTVNDIQEYKNVGTEIEHCFQSKDCLELSIQLYIASTLLEVYYSQNHDKNYIKYIEDEMWNYIRKSEKRMLKSFSSLQTIINHTKPYKIKDKNNNVMDKDNLQQQCNKVVQVLENEDVTSIQKLIHSALYTVTKKVEYYIRNNGDVYSKILDS